MPSLRMQFRRSEKATPRRKPDPPACRSSYQTPNRSPESHRRPTRGCLPRPTRGRRGRLRRQLPRAFPWPCRWPSALPATRPTVLPSPAYTCQRRRLVSCLPTTSALVGDSVHRRVPQLFVHAEREPAPASHSIVGRPELPPHGYLLTHRPPARARSTARSPKAAVRLVATHVAPRRIHHLDRPQRFVGPTNHGIHGS